MEKEEIKQLVTEELEKHDIELPNYEYDTVAENIAERIANLCNLPVVSCQLPTNETIQVLFDNGAHARFYADILEEVGCAGYHFKKGMEAMRDILLAAQGNCS